MPSPDVAEPFFSLRNIPLWICVILLLTFGALGVAHNQPKAEAPAAQVG